MTPTTPSLDLDPFSEDFLREPYAHHEALREAGPVVWLPRYGIWGMARHDEVHAALKDWETFCSSAGVGLSDFTKETPWRPPSLILEADPPQHARTRGVLARVLSVRALASLRDEFIRRAEPMVDALLARGCFDALAELAEAYPLEVFPDAVGLPAEGRAHLLPYGNMVFNAFGPRNARFEAAMAEADTVRETIAHMCARSSLASDGLGAQVYAAADAGEVTEAEAALLVRSLLSAGLDTTVLALGNAMWCFASHPEQWRKLKHSRATRAAFDEVLRFESPAQTFFRTTTRSVDIGGVVLDAREKVLMFLAAANRDPRRWEQPDCFDIERQAAGHLALGAGIHGCVGQALARLEADALLTVMLERVQHIELDGTPRRRLNNSLRGFAELPVKVTAD